MTKTEKKHVIFKERISYERGYADGLKAKSLELAPLIEKLIDKKTE
jgi:hypothetical protein